MKKNQAITYFEVRTKGDGDFEYFVAPAVEDDEENYDPQNKESAKAHAKEVKGYVVEVTEKRV